MNDKTQSRYILVLSLILVVGCGRGALAPKKAVVPNVEEGGEWESMPIEPKYPIPLEKTPLTWPVALSPNEAYVAHAYNILLGRDPEPRTPHDWVSRLDSGLMTKEQLIPQIILSQEYTNLYPTNEGFVVSLYRNLLRRNPDEYGFISWVGQLVSGKSRQEVVMGFLNSREYLQHPAF